VDVRNKKGSSPLWLAANGGHLEVLQALAASGADLDAQDNRKVTPLMAAFRKGHHKVVRWMVRHVTQFPSDQELSRFLATVTDKDLLKKCTQCLEIIAAAKEKQAAEANKNANILLEQLEAEQSREENKKAAAARRRQKKKSKKKDKKGTDGNDDDDVAGSNTKSTFFSGSGDDMDQDEDGDDEDYTSSAVPSVPADVPPAPFTPPLEEDKENQSKSKKAKRREKSKLKAESQSNQPVETSQASDSVDSGVANSKKQSVRVRNKEEEREPAKPEPVKAKEVQKGKQKPEEKAPVKEEKPAPKKERKEEEPPVVKEPEKKKEQQPVASAPSAKDKDLEASILSAQFEGTVVSSKKSKQRKKDQAAIARENDNVLRTENAMKEAMKSGLSPPSAMPVKAAGAQSKKEEDEWKEVVRTSISRPKKIVVPANAISRVIGRAGCNINRIRELSGAHIEVEKQGKSQTDRAISIK
jgi:ankyrin repeat domain-containing protein 17